MSQWLTEATSGQVVIRSVRLVSYIRTVTMAALSAKEKDLVFEFRQRIPDMLDKLSDYKRHDMWLVRWLRARDLDVNKAENMLRKSITWREENKVEELVNWKVPDFIDKEFTIKAPGFDKEGCIVATVPFGKWDIRKAISIGLKSELHRHIDQIFETAMGFMEHRSTPEQMYTQFVIILDFEGFSLRQLASKEAIEAVADILQRFEANNPETLKAGWVVNAPKIFEILFNLVKPLLTAHTLSKVNVFGSNSEHWRAELLKTIDPDQLPSQYGGCITTVKDYKVSDGYDIFPKFEVFPEDELITVNVEAGTKHTVEFSLSKGSELSWNFKTVDYDIGFTVVHNDDEDGSADQDLFSCKRADSHLHVQRGAVTAEKPGTYLLTFDNTFSRFRNKTLYYAVRVGSTIH